MPNIMVEIFEGRTLDQRRAFASAVTAAAESTLGVDASRVRITFREMSRNDVAVAGVLISDRDAVQ